MLRPLGIGREGSKKCVCESKIAEGGAALIPPSSGEPDPALPDEPALPGEPALSGDAAGEPALPEEPALGEPELPALPDTPSAPALPEGPVAMAPAWPAMSGAPSDVPDEHPTSTASHVEAVAAMNSRRENTLDLLLWANDLVVVDR